ncbi:MAG: hypothetical protein HRU03_05565 [Nanoarchaeales archaeon]|nr:hypothetical protein [Nanoarchaeales archaeon]
MKLKLNLKKISTVTIAASMLLLAGCSSGGSSSSTSGSSSGFNPSSSFNGGSDALSFSFEKSAPPEKIRDQGMETFAVRLLIKNEGEADIAENTGYVSLAGIDKSVYNLVESSKFIPQLDGYKVQGSNTLDGRFQYVIFSNLKYSGEVLGSTTERLIANICYPYQTRASTNLCVSGDTSSYVDEDLKICDLEGNRNVASSGGPLSVENVKQYPSGASKITFQFDIVHNPKQATSTLYESGSIGPNCKIHGELPTSSNSRARQNKVIFDVTTGINGLDCGNDNSVTLYDNRATVICSQDTSGLEEFEKPIKITLDYEYFDRISTDITIEHLQR